MRRPAPARSTYPASLRCDGEMFGLPARALSAIKSYQIHFKTSQTNFDLSRCNLEGGNFTYKPWDAARECLTATLDIVNPALDRRYDLPPLEVGIGLGYSKAIITTIGENNAHPKIIGECVYRASRLCGERNEIAIDSHLEAAWPKDPKKGRVSMRGIKRDGVDGYIVTWNSDRD